MRRIAKAAEIAAAVPGASTGPPNGWFLMPCPAHGGKDNNLHIRDDGDGLKARCHSYECDYWDILRGLERVTGLHIIPAKRTGKGLGSLLPRRQQQKPTQQKRSMTQQPKTQHKTLTEAEKIAICDQLRDSAGTGTYPAEHPCMRYLLEKETHPCWEPNVKLPVDAISISALPTELASWRKSFAGAVGCLLGSFRRSPESEPEAIASVWFDRDGQSAKWLRRGKNAGNKRSFAKQRGLVWMNDKLARGGVLYVTEGLVEAIRVRHLLRGCDWANVGATVGGLGTIRDRLQSASFLAALRSYQRVVLVSDGDEPGQKSAGGAFVAMLAKRISVDMVWLPTGDDPASVPTDWILPKLMSFRPQEHTSTDDSREGLSEEKPSAVVPSVPENVPTVPISVPERTEPVDDAQNLPNGAFSVADRHVDATVPEKTHSAANTAVSVPEIVDGAIYYPPGTPPQSGTGHCARCGWLSNRMRFVFDENAVWCLRCTEEAAVGVVPQLEMS